MNLFNKVLKGILGRGNTPILVNNDHKKRVELLINTVVNGLNTVQPPPSDREFADLLMNLTSQYNSQLLTKNSQLSERVKTLSKLANLPDDPTQQPESGEREDKK